MDYWKILGKHIFDTIESTRRRVYHAGQLLIFNVEVMRNRTRDANTLDSKQRAQTSVNEYRKCINKLKELHAAYNCMQERNQTQLIIPPRGFCDGK